MGWKPGVRWDKANKYHYTRYQGKKHYLGTDYADAHRRFADIVGAAAPREAPESLAEAVLMYQAENPVPFNEERLKAWVRHTPRLLLSDINDAALAEYAAHMKAEGLSPWTMHHNIRLARSLCQWCVKHGWMAKVPERPKLPKPDKGHRDVPTPKLKEVIEGLQQMRDQNALPLVRFSLAVGCRPGEARLLRWGQVNLNDDVCEIKEHKTRHRTGRTRTIYLTPEAVEILKNQPRKSEYVFLSRLKRPYTASGIRSVLHRLGISGPQCLRHTFAQNALAQASMEDVAKLLGHSDLRTVQVYAQIRDRRALDV